MISNFGAKSMSISAVCRYLSVFPQNRELYEHMKPTTSVPRSPRGSLLVASPTLLVTRVYSCVVPRQARCLPPMTRTFANTQARKLRATRNFADTQARNLRPARTFANTRKVRCQASQGRAGNFSNNPYNIPPIIELDEATREKTDRCAVILGVVALLLFAYRYSQHGLPRTYTSLIFQAVLIFLNVACVTDFL